MNYRSPENFQPESSYSTESNGTYEVSKEELFRLAAIKCAYMEEELVSHLIKSPEILDNSNLRIVNNDIMCLIESSLENLGRKIGQPAKIAFRHLKKGNNGPTVLFLDFDSINTLYISMHTDLPTMERYENLECINPQSVRFAVTNYYFTSEGVYGKLSDIPQSLIVPPPRRSHTYPSSSIENNLYTSEMTAEDFELAGHALQMLINRLKTQEELGMDSGTEEE